MWSMFTHPWLRVGWWWWGGGEGLWVCVDTWGSAGVRRSVDSKCVQMYVCSRQLMHHRRIKCLFIGLLLHNSIIHHTYNVFLFLFFFFLLLNLRVIWQTCATVNVRYFPWGKLGWEGLGTLLAMGLPENKGGGTGTEALFIGVTVSSPLTVNSASPSTGTLHVALSIHKYTSHTTHTHAPSLQHGGESSSIDTAYNAWIYVKYFRTTGFFLTLTQVSPSWANTHTAWSASFQTVRHFQIFLFRCCTSAHWSLQRLLG